VGLLRGSGSGSVEERSVGRTRGEKEGREQLKATRRVAAMAAALTLARAREKTQWWWLRLQGGTRQVVTPDR
jgi:hypothetical protein